MVLAQLGGSICRAVDQISNATIIEDNVMNECLNKISRALLQSDVNFKLVRDMETNIKKIVNLYDLSGGHKKHRLLVFSFHKSQRFINQYHQENTKPGGSAYLTPTGTIALTAPKTEENPSDQVPILWTGSERC
ncbi:hypothetical protein Dsin_005491 [Dipteronia sinensis]|uniref:Signal recognition particle SRP54 helical bundle domain-containing protein n=1 Tax=Dipteronia sinensis TaxID=43782 RepID=A0AAE0AXV9_9ROSI|nr:hypothetical protein Dsin_005491 [Dipteronia sinensis]